VIIFVPTPLNKDREPDLSYVLRTGRAIAPYLAPDHRAPRPSSIPGPGGEEPESPQPKSVVLESTTYPGTTEENLRGHLGGNPRSENKAFGFMPFYPGPGLGEARKWPITTHMCR
jgi:hypothetical protein